MNKPSKEKSQRKLNVLAPWVHPKAKKWFGELFDQSGFIMKLRDVLDNSEQPVSPSEARILMMIVAILGKEGIWPEEQRKDMSRIVMKLGRLAKNTSASPGTKPLTMDQHRKSKIVAEEVEHELEILRRMAGISNRVSDMYMPKSWGQFWT